MKRQILENIANEIDLALEKAYQAGIDKKLFEENFKVLARFYQAEQIHKPPYMVMVFSILDIDHNPYQINYKLYTAVAGIFLDGLDSFIVKNNDADKEPMRSFAASLSELCKDIKEGEAKFLGIIKLIDAYINLNEREINAEDELTVIKTSKKKNLVSDIRKTAINVAYLVKSIPVFKSDEKQNERKTIQYDMKRKFSTDDRKALILKLEANPNNSTILFSHALNDTEKWNAILDFIKDKKNSKKGTYDDIYSEAVSLIKNKVQIELEGFEDDWTNINKN